VVRLGDRIQQLLVVAAAAGPGVTQPLLAAVTGMDDQQLLEGLREAVNQQLLVPEPGGEGYLFRHALLAEETLWVLSDLVRQGKLRALAARPSRPRRSSRRNGSPNAAGWDALDRAATLLAAGQRDRSVGAAGLPALRDGGAGLEPPLGGGCCPAATARASRSI
jgi:hypothetical protein